ncbi:myeloperoxidase-like isoform X2 [Centruroides vittatus]|uniref:myeloperoxidase-like isoform X2 n=1 Tax=Centruroides vittatus TaxID=120091 RepID=UPI00350F3A93
MYFNVALSLALCVIFVSAREIEELFSLIDNDYLRELVRNAELEMEKIREIESKAKYLNPYIISAEGRHQLKTCPAYKRNDVQAMLEIMTRDIVSRYDLDSSDINLLRQYPLKNMEITKQLHEQCVDNRPVDCTNIKYPTIDGSCNHLDRPNEGRTFSCFDRLLPPDYADGVSSPRVCTGCSTPEPRDITLKIHRTLHGKHSHTHTAMLSGFGQFLDHDMLFTTQPESDTLTAIECCEGPPIHETCFSLEIPPNDPDFSDITCMNFVRDAQCTTCNLGWREQMNSLTPAIDCSQVYDTELNRSRRIRRLDGSGKLASRMTPVGELPLTDTDPTRDQCNSDYPRFLTGDFRSSQNPLLTSLQIIFLRLHNLIAEKLKRINRRWNGETIYQEARKILICIYLRIIYFEYIPLIIGPVYTRRYKISEENTEYDPSVPFKLFNDFAGSVFRLHSIVPDPIFLVTEDGTMEEIQLRDNFCIDDYILNRGIEDVLRGSTKQLEENYDRLLVQSLTTFLYRVNNTRIGLDLASININRGRDQGLPPYIKYVFFLYGIKIEKFSDLFECGLMEYSTVKKLQEVYQCVECIDFFTGLVCEKRLKHATVGRTAATIIGLQFYRLKYGWRHYCGHKGCLQPDQMEFIKTVKLSHLICYTTNISKIEENVFVLGGPLINCDDVRRRWDFSAWKEK